jgi:ubiquinone/menaquinone biosynthesis C-methylase UbiE
MPGDIRNKLALVVYLRHLFAYETASEILKDRNKIIEIGSGEGYGAAYLSDGPFDISCYDLSAEIAQHANKTYPRNNLHFAEFDGKRIPQDDNTFDAAISFQVIEHVPNVSAYLKEIHRVLKPGGIFLCTTPNRQYRLKPGQKPWNEFHLREYYDHELQKEMKNIFQISEVWGIRAKEELQQMEYNRVKNSKNSSPLKNLIPLSLRKWVKSSLKKNKNQPKEEENFKDKYSLKDYHVIKNRVNEDSLDLLGYCIK